MYQECHEMNERSKDAYFRARSIAMTYPDDNCFGDYSIDLGHLPNLPSTVSVGHIGGETSNFRRTCSSETLRLIFVVHRRFKCSNCVERSLPAASGRV